MAGRTTASIDLDHERKPLRDLLRATVDAVREKTDCAFCSVGARLVEVVQDRIANFDATAARQAADLAAALKLKGRPRDSRDTMIAGIVLASHATLATHNIRHFDDIAKSVVNPWESD